MIIETVRGEEWAVDNNLRQMARDLISENRDLLGYLDLNKIMFITITGKSTADWYGKCYRLSNAAKLLPTYITEVICAGDVDAMDRYEEYLDIRFIVAINRATIESAGIMEIDDIIKITLKHELLHIDEDMEKLVKHDIQDFSIILREHGLSWTKGIFKKGSDVEDES